MFVIDKIGLPQLGLTGLEADLSEEERPVTMVNSARRLEEIRKEVEGLDVFDIVTKPFDIAEIEKRVALACSEKLRRLGG